MRPYTLGHEAELLRQENALFTLTYAEFDAIPEAQQRQAIVGAVDICSQTWGEYAESASLLAARPKWHQFGLRRRQKRLRSIWRRWQAALARLEPTDWAIAVAEFRNYVHDGRKCLPALSADDPDDVLAIAATGEGEKLEPGRSMGSPSLAHLISFAIEADLARHVGVSVVFDVPFSLCANLHLARLEDKGSIYIRNEKEHGAREEAEACRKAALAESEAEKAETCQAKL